MLSHFSRVRLFATLWTVAHQAPLSMRFSRQEYWSGLPCPPPADTLINPGFENQGSFPVLVEGRGHCIPLSLLVERLSKSLPKIWDKIVKNKDNHLGALEINQRQNNKLRRLCLPKIKLSVRKLGVWKVLPGTAPISTPSCGSSWAGLTIKNNNLHHRRGLI